MSDLSGGYEQHPFFAQSYDHIEFHRTREDINFYSKVAGKEGGPILELGCGTGRVMIPLARDGYHVTGLDLSSNMLSELKRKLDSELSEIRDRIDYVRGDMSNFELDRRFRLVTIPFRSFQALTTRDRQISCLECIRNHLGDQGLLVLDLFNPYLPFLLMDKDSQMNEFRAELDLPDGTHVVRTSYNRAVDFNRQIVESDLVYDLTYPAGQSERLLQNLKLKYLFRYEAEHLLARCGYEIEAIYADYDFTPFGDKYPSEMIFLARKK
ncbi:MAG: methyltransferase domain-containing protein [candidate division Zixibacteria bacterium]|nr:methyltransferase domain-containing protein [candidate division Zixibacteria bacterium]